MLQKQRQWWEITVEVWSTNMSHASYSCFTVTWFRVKLKACDWRAAGSVLSNSWIKQRICGIITSTEVCQKTTFCQCSSQYYWTSVRLLWITFIIRSRAYGRHLGSPRSLWFCLSAHPKGQHGVTKKSVTGSGCCRGFVVVQQYSFE